MKKIGKIGAYDQATGKGVILINDSNEKVEFSIINWNDNEILPSFGAFVEVTEEGISPLTEEIILDDEFTFTQLRNELYNEYKRIHPDFVIKSDKVNSFLIKCNNDGYVHLKENDDGIISIDFFNSKLSKSFIENFSKYNIDIKYVEDGNEKTINHTVKSTNTYTSTSNKQSTDNTIKNDDNQTLGIIALILSLVGIIVAPIIMQPIALIVGIMSKNIIGKVGAAIAGIHLAIIIISLIVGAGLVLSLT